MKDIIKINNLTFRYSNKFVFDKFNLNIHEGEWLTIVGPNGSGKSTLIKILAGLLETDCHILIDGLDLTKNNLSYIRKKMGVIFEHVDDMFIGETVEEEIAFTLENLAYDRKTIHEMVNEIASLLKIENLLKMDPTLLSGGEKQKVALAATLVSKPKILLIDDSIEMIDEKTKNEIIELLDKLHKEMHLTIVTVTHNLDETYKADRMIVINDGVILIDGPVLKVLEEDKIFNRVGIEVPFMVDLSIKLKLYGLIDNIILDMDKLVNTLWK